MIWGIVQIPIGLLMAIGTVIILSILIAIVRFHAALRRLRPHGNAGLLPE